jgi:hypothetical protein
MEIEPDPAVEVTRRARKQISSQLGHDPARLIAYYCEMQRRFGDRLRHGPPDDEPVEDDTEVRGRPSG